MALKTCTIRCLRWLYEHRFYLPYVLSAGCEVVQDHFWPLTSDHNANAIEKWSCKTRRIAITAPTESNGMTTTKRKRIKKKKPKANIFREQNNFNFFFQLSARTIVVVDHTNTPSHFTWQFYWRIFLSIGLCRLTTGGSDFFFRRQQFVFFQYLSAKWIHWKYGK